LEYYLPTHSIDVTLSDWEEAYTNIKAVLGLPTESPTPKIPRPNNNLKTPLNSISSVPPNQTKRKAVDQDGDVGMSDLVEEPSKRAKNISLKHSSGPNGTPDPAVEHAHAAAAFIPFLTPENLLPPKLPTREEMEGVLLNLRKQALVEEYFGNGDQQS
jgi:pre-mRNA-splicing factor ISY1